MQQSNRNIFESKKLNKFLFFFFVLKPEAYDSSSNITQTIRMIETHWRVHLNGEAASRGVFMAALQNITQLFVRGTSSVAFTSLT